MLPLPLPESLAALLSAFAIAFTRPTFAHVQLLVTGTLLTSARRTLASALRAVGLGGERHFTTYHWVLNRSVWSPLRLSRILLHLLITAFLAPDAPLVLLIDGTLERRWGPKIALKGRYHDAVRSQPVMSSRPRASIGCASRCSFPARGASASGRCRS
jgi:DDE superfamily endonuclease